MKKNLIRGAICLAIIIIAGGLAFLLTERITHHTHVILPIQEKRMDVYETMHEMANTKIISEDGEIWGQIDITPGNIEKVRKAIKEQHIDDDELNAMLDKWSKGDFSECVVEHNYLWEHLNGTVGFAIKLKK